METSFKVTLTAKRLLKTELVVTANDMIKARDTALAAVNTPDYPWEESNVTDFRVSEVESLTIVKDGPVVYPIYHDRIGITQYDENVFVWADETENARGVAATFDEAVSDQLRYSKGLG